MRKIKLRTVSSNQGVTFKASLKGEIENLDVIIQNKLVPSPDFIVNYQASIADSALNVIFQVSGNNGTGFTINYTCLSAGNSKTDQQNPGPLSGEVSQSGYTEIELTIPLI